MRCHRRAVLRVELLRGGRRGRGRLPLKTDASRLKQVRHNLITNGSLESKHPVDG
jgi:hypothetical protein